MAAAQEKSHSGMTDCVAIVEQMLRHYNAHDVENYVALMTDDACQANYRGAVMRDGKPAIREGLQTTFDQFPELRGDILSSHGLGDFVVLHERMLLTPTSEPRELMSIYSFRDDKVDRVEFIR